MLGLELKPSRNRFRIGREAPIESEGSCIAAVADQGVDQKEVSLACSYDPSAIRRHIDTNDRVSKCRECGLKSSTSQSTTTHRRQSVPAHLGILPDRVEESNVTLVTSDRDPPRLGCRRSGKVVLGSILLELRLDQLVTLDSGIDSEKTIVGCSKGVLSGETQTSRISRNYSQCPIRV